MAKSGKLQLMFLSKTIVNHSIEILVLKMTSSKSGKLLGLTIDHKLNFDIHINNLCKVASAKFKDLERIWKRINKSVLQPREVYNSFILFQFNYCFLIWIICNKNLQSAIS